MSFISNINKEKLISSGLTLSGLPGQIAARAIYQQGSIDKPWLMLFAFPPWSALPAAAMYFDKISPGENGKPYDVKCFIAIILMFFIPLLIYKLMNPDGILFNAGRNFIGPFIQLLFIGIIYYVFKKRFDEKCSNRSANSKASFFHSIDRQALVHAILLAPLVPLVGRLIMMFVGNLLNKLADFNIDLSGILNLSIFENLLSNGSDVDNNDLLMLQLSSAIGFGVIYVLLNMYYSTKSNLNKTCSNIINKKVIITGLVLNLIIPLFIKPNLVDNLIDE